MGLRDNAIKGLRAFSYGSDEARQAHQNEMRMDLNKKMSFATAIIEGVKQDLVDPKEGAQALKNLGPQFEQLTVAGNMPPAQLAGQGGGPPTPEQSEAQRTTLFSPEERKLTRFDAEDKSGNRFTAFTDQEGNMFVRRGGELVTAPEDTVQHRAASASADPQVPSPTKSEIDTTTRYVGHRWPKDVPKMSKEDTAVFMDKVSAAAKEYARKNKVSFGKGLTAVWDQAMAENVQVGEKDAWLWFDKKSELKSPDEIDAPQDDLIRRKTADGRVALFDKDQNFVRYE